MYDTSLWLGGWHPIFDIAPLIWIPGFIWFLGKLMGMHRMRCDVDLRRWSALTRLVPQNLMLSWTV